ncbi:EF-hand domain-containing protein [Jannaschia sp. Os4]|uniref:EF-hand domain-containing protein n=1 Tax=Jannaschia sp. Os4 TaxID=2807617 RepID=UPI001939EE61|nr:EF-hand domain-containing protein [Jannaschia sp. Os4]MBM2576351.1 EF-hand domain-containing protein [Jannaschia sp. Os4]
MLRFLASTLLLAAAPASGQETDAAASVDAARAAVEAQALDLDADGDGLIGRAEVAAAVAASFPTFDADGSGDIDPREWEEWPFGFYDMALHRDRAQAYHAAFGLVFDLFDRSGDGRLDEAEFAGAMDRALDFADRDGDGAMSHEEFLRGFVPNVALRHAMRD